MSVQSFEDFFDLKKKNYYGPWNIEQETLVVRYCDCNLSCPICYTAGSSYLHRLMNKREPLNTKSASKSRKLTYSTLDTPPSNALEKMVKKRYVRIQGGEPIFNSRYNKFRARLTAKLAIDIISQLYHNRHILSLDRFVVVIQTNGIYLGLKEDYAQDFIDALIDYAKEAHLLDILNTGAIYRIAIEISFKAPNAADFAIFSGTNYRYLWKKQIDAYWNLINALKSSTYPLNGIAVYPIAGFLTPLDGCGIVPISTVDDEEKPLFHISTWDNDFGDVINNYFSALDKEPRYKYYRDHLIRKFGTSDYRKIRGETLTLYSKTGAVFFQRHVPSLHRRYQAFRRHFDSFKNHFGLCSTETNWDCSNKPMYREYKRLGLTEIDLNLCKKWRDQLSKIFFDEPSIRYYPCL